MPDTLRTRDYYRAARDLLSEMDDETREKIKALLQEAEKGVKTDNQIVDIITEDRRLRRRFRELLGVEVEKALGAYTPLGGDVPAISALKFICPAEGCGYTRRIARVGEDPGNCPRHGLPLLPASSGQRGG